MILGPVMGEFRVASNHSGCGVWRIDPNLAPGESFLTCVDTNASQRRGWGEVEGNPMERIRTRNAALDKGVGALQDQAGALSRGIRVTHCYLATLSRCAIRIAYVGKRFPFSA
jgi:hypothetical protein